MLKLRRTRCVVRNCAAALTLRLLAAQVAARFSATFESDEMAPPDSPLLLTSSVTRVDDAAEPYNVQIAITLSAAPDGSGQARARGCERGCARLASLGFAAHMR